MHIYCLFCETGKCASVASAVTQLVPCRAISPKQVQHTWSKGRMVDVVHDLLPGYVLVYVEGEPMDVSVLSSVEGFIRCLSVADGEKGRRYELGGSDEQFALMLLSQDGIIGKTKVYQEGQMIRIVQGAYRGVETRILKVQRRNMRMQIEIPFAGRFIRTWVEYEVVQPLDQEERQGRDTEYPAEKG